MRRKLVPLLMIALTAAAAGAGWLLGRQLNNRRDVAAVTAAPSASLISVPVTQGRVEKRIALRATLRSSFVVELRTDLPDLGFLPAISYVVPPGRTLREGEVLYAVAGNPVLLLKGDLPMLRDVTLGSKGEDILQLQRSLKRLRLDPGPITGVYHRATAIAVARLIRARGYNPTPIGDPVEPTTPGDPSDQPLVPAQLPRWSIVFVRKLPLQVASTNLVRGGIATDGVVSLVTGAPILVGAVPSNEATLLKVGSAATVVDDAGIEHDASVVFVAERPTSGASGRPAFEFKIATAEPLRLQAGTNLLVRVLVGTSGDSAISVPYAALTSRADGSTVVTVLEGKQLRVVRVTVGVEGESAVEVIPANNDLKAGDLVVVGQK